MTAPPPLDRSALHTMQVALAANAAAYRRGVQASAPGDCWDFVVLTAANEKQAEGYRQELALRHRAVGPTGAFFPAIQRSVVVADPPGRRAGSGGATFGVMKALATQFGLAPADFDRLRILLIHSGGASQRLPAYSPLGKIFAPLPLLRPDGQVATLFDHLYLTLAGLPERLGPGMLVLAGDVFLLFDHRHVSPPPPGVTALSMRVDADLGRGHGVFVTDAQGRITKTLQKVSVDAMRDAGATDASGRVLIDTGILFFDAPQARGLASLAGVGARGKSPAGIQDRFPDQIDLYEDMTAALATGTTAAEYLRPAGARAMRRQLWKALHGTPFNLATLEGEFLHLGTTRQFRDAMIGQNPSPAAELFQQNVLAHSDWRLEPGRRVYHSALLQDHGKQGSLGAGSVVEHSILRAPSRVGAGCVVSQVVAIDKTIVLPDDMLLFQVPVRTPDASPPSHAAGKKRSPRARRDATAPRDRLLFVHVLCGVEDDFKGRFADGKCQYLNAPVDQWMTRHGVAPKDLWPGVPADRQTLWTARLFVGTPERDAVDVALRLGPGRPAGSRAVDAWRKAPRFSMAQMLEQSDPASLIEHREIVAAYLQTGELLGSIRRREDAPAEGYLGHYTTPGAYAAAERRVAGWAAEPTADANVAIDQARAFWCAAQLLQRPNHPDPAGRARIEPFMRSAFAKVAQASEIGHATVGVASPPASRGPAPARGPRVRPGLEVVATAPVRLDLSGGWTDTPPYCFERGGHVINVAIDLDGRPPVRATVRTTKELRVTLDSHDLGKQVDLTRVAPGPVDVTDPFALHKVALGLVGFLPTDGGDVARHLKPLGVGLHLTTECRVPKGSGLGTSSILAATLLAALHRVRGDEPSATELVEQALLLEQRLSTGGGWQDQVGGIVGGVKSTVTAPGVPQRPVIEPLHLSDSRYDELQQRLVVYYSGQQRLARDILRRVLGRWLAREPAVLGLMDELKSSAAALRAAILRGNWPAAGHEIARYWRVKRDLYPGSTTPSIDVMLLDLRGHYLAAGLAGAGGGGFAYFFCETPEQADALRASLAERSARPGSLGNVYATQINRAGLTVTTNRG